MAHRFTRSWAEASPRTGCRPRLDANLHLAKCGMGLAAVVFGFFVVGFTFLAIFGGRRKYWSTVDDLGTFGGLLEGPELNYDPGVFKSLANTQLSGVLEGRRVRVRFRHGGLHLSGGRNWRKTYVLRMEANVANAAAAFKVTPVGILSNLGVATGVVSDVQVGDAGFDSEYVVSGVGPEVRMLFERPGLHELIDELTKRHKLTSIELEGGWLVFERARTTGISPAGMQRTFVGLLELAGQCERPRTEGKPRGIPLVDPSDSKPNPGPAECA